MKPTVYIETTIPSYLTARPSRDLVVASHQQETKEWWDTRDAFELFISPIVVTECGAGDPSAATLRLEALKGIAILSETKAVTDMAHALMHQLHLPKHAEADAFHIAMCAVHDIQYLMTWNCTHLANVQLQPLIEAVCTSQSYRTPIICVPSMLKANPRQS